MAVPNANVGKDNAAVPERRKVESLLGKGGDLSVPEKQ